MSTTPFSQCAFCTRPSVYEGKCNTHRYRLRCSVENCSNQTYARYLCVQHGGKQQCQIDGCQSNARRYGLCCKHGTRVRKLCSADGCKNIAHARGCCIKHGGGRKCKWTLGCAQSARIDGYCLNHCREVMNPSPSLTNEELDILTSLLGCVDADCDELVVHFEIGPTDAVNREMDALFSSEGIGFRGDVHVEEIASFLP
ncbi:hypothetical protein AeMF1_007291 [Aphanomyces euteiches]|nr:hypothetical protein AeMF1_007291 [Aphanomyces euteiches]KAH9194138.1 hypothetical protein AeNC1_003892 [Aphanomyces euteiches]